jgi:hypothetical protein
MSLTKQIKRFEKLILDNSPTVLTGVAVAGTITTAVLTGRASVKAFRILDEQAEQVWQEPIPYTECVKMVWRLYIPPVAVGAGTIACIVMANRIGNRRAAAIAAAYAISEKAMAEYKEKVIDRIGEQKEQAIRDEIAQDQVARTPGSNAVVLVGYGDVLCFDSYSGRYFNSSVENIKKAENELNHRILNDMYASLTDWYNLIGIASIEFSDEVGWNVDKLLEVRFSSVLTDDNKPCLSVDFNVSPIRDYYRLH